MRRLVFLFAVLLCGCVSNHESSKETLKTGDLLFVALPLDYTLQDSNSMDDAIVSATGDSASVNYIHVAIVEVNGDSTWVIDATLKHGVDRHPIDTFWTDFTLKDGSLPRVDVMRLSDTNGVSGFISLAKKFCGRGYDLYFLPENKEQYCSELVRNSYVRNGDTLFSQNPMNFKSKDGSFPPYWVDLFALLGEDIPQGKMGTNPNAMSKESVLYRVNLNLHR